MAAVTLLGSTFTTTANAKSVTATPAVDDLIIIIAAHSGSGGGSLPTDDNGSGTYSLVAAAGAAAAADTVEVFVRTAKIGSAVSTIFTHSVASTGGGLVILKVTGMSKVGLAAIRQSALQDDFSSGTPAPAFASAVLTANAVIGAILNATNPATMTPRTSFTERADLGYATPTTGLEVMSRDSGETGTTMTWGF